MNPNFFYSSMIKVVMNLKDDNNNISYILKETGLLWTQIKKSLELLYIYDFIEMNKLKGKYNFELTEDGKKLRDYFCNASALITKHKKRIEVGLYGYNSKEEMIQDVRKDIIQPMETISDTTTTFT